MSGQLCSYASFKGPDEEQRKVEAHHTVVFGDGDAIKVQNKVRTKRKKPPVVKLSRRVSRFRIVNIITLLLVTVFHV